MFKKAILIIFVVFLLFSGVVAKNTSLTAYANTIELKEYPGQLATYINYNDPVLVGEFNIPSNNELLPSYFQLESEYVGGGLTVVMVMNLDRQSVELGQIGIISVEIFQSMTSTIENNTIKNKAIGISTNINTMQQILYDNGFNVLNFTVKNNLDEDVLFEFKNAESEYNLYNLNFSSHQGFLIEELELFDVDNSILISSIPAQRYVSVGELQPIPYENNTPIYLNDVGMENGLYKKQGNLFEGLYTKANVYNIQTGESLQGVNLYNYLNNIVDPVDPYQPVYMENALIGFGIIGTIAIVTIIGGLIGGTIAIIEKLTGIDLFFLDDLVENAFELLKDIIGGVGDAVVGVIPDVLNTQPFLFIGIAIGLAILLNTYFKNQKQTQKK